MSSIEERVSEDQRIFKIILPPRRTWASLTKKNRYRGLENRRITSIDQNKKSLEITLSRDKKRGAPYYQLQEQILKGLRRRVLACKYEFSGPKVSKVIKNDTAYRPVCSFPIFDNIILQETNRILSEWFDSFFCDSSFAFRVANKGRKAPTHHDTIVKILEYIENHKEQQVYVAECDLKKFFDTINHEIIEESYFKFLGQVEKPSREKSILTHLFMSYLRCYDFQKSIEKLNYDKKFMEGSEGRFFHWIEKDCLETVYGDTYKTELIGVPQGGALSGLIANIVLHDVDFALEQLKDPDLLYLRFCDDMIMLHTNKEKLGEAFEIYQNELEDKKLFIHAPVDVTQYSAKYYESKSKNPFVLGSVDSGSIPWITFVGYDINYLGEVRVRKSSIQKQIDKQAKVVTRTLGIVKRSCAPYKRQSVIESVRARLIGMSVGSITLYGDNKVKQMCWAKGFPCLTKNEYSIRQMKRLDKSRRKQLWYLYRNLPPEAIPTEKTYTPTDDKSVANSVDMLSEDNKSSSSKNIKRRQIIYHGKPYSYYHWLDEKERSYHQE